MHTISRLKHWVRMMHDEGAKAVHFSGPIMHEKSFWGVIALFLLLVTLFTLITLFGDQLPISAGRYRSC